MISKNTTVSTAENISSMEKLFANIRCALFLSPAPSFTENVTDPPIPIRAANEDKSVMIGAHTPRGKGIPADHRNISDIDPVYNTVEHIDELGKHKRN